MNFRFALAFFFLPFISISQNKKQLQELVDQTLEKIEQLNQEVANQDKQIDQLSSGQILQKNKIIELRYSNEELSKENNKLENENASLRKQLNELKSKHLSKSKEIPANDHQALICSLDSSRQKLLVEIEDMKDSLTKLEKSIVRKIDENGFEFIIHCPPHEKIEVVDRKSYIDRKTIMEISNGNKIKVIGIDGLYYTVQIEEKFGYISSIKFDPGYPVSLLEKYKNYKGATSTYSKTNSQSISGCSSKRCSGYTKKGSRCKRTTTNCNGRCHSN